MEGGPSSGRESTTEAIKFNETLVRADEKWGRPEGKFRLGPPRQRLALQTRHLPKHRKSA